MRKGAGQGGGPGIDQRKNDRIEMLGTLLKKRAPLVVIGVHARITDVEISTVLGVLFSHQTLKDCWVDFDGGHLGGPIHEARPDISASARSDDGGAFHLTRIVGRGPEIVLKRFQSGRKASVENGR